MMFEETFIKGVILIRQKSFCDSRGYFTRVFCKREFAENGIHTSFVQSNLCQNKVAGTLRGLHVQRSGAEEEKLLMCTRGRIFDVCVDVRENSQTYGKYVAFELSEENGNMLFIPKGCAHGYLTLEDNCQLLYYMSEFYSVDSSYGFMYDDSMFSIDWPIEVPYILSEQDLKWEYIPK